MNGIKILGTGRGVPSKLVTNEDMAKIVDTNDWCPPPPAACSMS